MEISDLMSLMKGRDFYFYSKDDGRPWSDESAKPDIFFHCAGKRTTLDSSDSLALSYLASSAHHFVDPSRFAISWDAKNVFSFIQGRTGIPMEFGCPVYDLRIISSYLGVETELPAKFRDAVNLLGQLFKHPGWEEFSELYKSVYVPLITKVIPDMETCCLVDNHKRMCVFPQYVPEGQANGRLKALLGSESNYNPHSMGPDQKSNIRPSKYDDVFVYFDYKNMEVNVLQWLSGDETLGEILSSEEDPYTAIWSMVLRDKATEAHRQLCKDVFLPVIFGQGSRSLAASMGVEEKIASKIIHILAKTFPVAFDWVSSQSPNGDNIAKDFFGRRRYFSGRDLYKIRNFSIQSPASMICLRKLVRLHESLSGLARVCFHVHDGYCVVCAADKADSVSEIGLNVLEEEDGLFPDLHLKATCHSGNRLDELKQTQPGAIR